MSQTVSKVADAMGNSPRSFRDPTYDEIDARVERRLGLPGGLLSNIRTRGERSNADQVSSAGARSVYQITPATRRAVIKKYGVDAYLGPDQAGLAAGYILKEGLDRNGGSAREAVAEYHAGTDRRNRGPVNRAYVARVTRQPYSGRASTPAESTYDRVRQRRAAAENAAPSLANVYDAYRTGRMSGPERAEFEADVASGAVLLPRGAKVAAPQRAPAATMLPAGVVEAFNSGEMEAADRAELLADVEAGIVKVPNGAKLVPPAPRSMMENVGLGVRNVATGLAGAADFFVGAPVNAIVNALPASRDIPHHHSSTPQQQARTR